MTFRQNNKDAERRWRIAHRQELILAGLPASVVEHERSWHYVLLHGDDAYGSGWSLEWISNDQARQLLALLRSFYANGLGLDLILELERRTQRDANR